MIELVWDTARVGTATSSSGATLTVGDHSAFSPDDLMAAAVASCVMRTFLRRASEGGLSILSYAATAQTCGPGQSADAPAVVVHVYLLAPAGADARRLTDLVAESAQASPIAQRLACRPAVTSDVRVLHTPDGTVQ